MPSSCRPSATAWPMLSGFAAPGTMASGFTPGILRQKKGDRGRLFYCCSVRLLEAIDHADAEHVDITLVLDTVDIVARLHLRIALPFRPHADVAVEVISGTQAERDVRARLVAVVRARQLHLADVKSEAA